jgi:hypothetical protein
VALNVCCVTPIFCQSEEEEQQQHLPWSKNKTKKEKHNRYEEMTREPLRGSQRMCQQTRETTVHPDTVCFSFFRDFLPINI